MCKWIRTAVLIVGTKLNKQNSQPGGGLPVSDLQSVEELNLGATNTNPSAGREEDLNSGPQVYKYSALNH